MAFFVTSSFAKVWLIVVFVHFVLCTLIIKGCFFCPHRLNFTKKHIKQSYCDAETTLWKTEDLLCSIQLNRDYFCFQEEYACNIFSLIKWERHYLGKKKTNNVQVILFALPVFKHKTNKGRNYLPRIHPQPITAVACYFLSEMDTFTFYHFVYLFYQQGACLASQADFVLILLQT